MATMRDHLKTVHEKSAESHIRMAKAHRTISNHFGKSEMVEGSKDLAAAHEELASAHTDAADYHVSCCKELLAAGKLLSGEDLEKIAPDSVSGINRYPERGVQMIPRPGAPALGKATVPQEFSHLVSVDET
jgi:hypothetical protein